ncbi:MAG: aspartyl-phosphate phosphatase Spo0E family protein [Bacillus sp. (in: firmicutes)]
MIGLKRKELIQISRYVNSFSDMQLVKASQELDSLIVRAIIKKDENKKTKQLTELDSEA